MEWPSASLTLCQEADTKPDFFFFFGIYLFLSDDCFTVLLLFLSYISMN